MFTYHIYLIYINKPDLALSNLQWLICHINLTKPKPSGFPTTISVTQREPPGIIHLYTHTYIHKL